MVPLLVAAAVGAGVMVVGAPFAVGALGFTQVGIAGASVAAKMMSAAAIANGGGVAAGSVVSVLQSVGAVGFSVAGKSILAATGAAAGMACKALKR
ncbi:interferon alpha-inducible protein 27-like protein 2A [Latimeria chalumnae]|uniref:Uncharacterized protein n=1 Tax=Latimeria chalumnae TaxID=7897 RepID=H2ZRK3_LATCH|nr:PREDICTED: interferon alpha-inducible protein 27-like protein 2A [Latimeria chalumnae]XP_006011980.1 PREDICTED: interferon alpha-inducible protein 27-like protein 2A [Latimeria chalumnae]XP_006011981.1 PREDICTED: interferon alpha-inducible protein 27-like protein 2A [Latimeria chalumnae]|eukprot:XP_006011979.1 PREDICTED: interferon alpha-inducible protein 27-like protein 2A [Latimeria chalumnae]